jgi:hypothetical protein
LFYEGGAFQWTNTAFENCQWHFRGAALETVRLLSTIGLLKAAQTPPTTMPPTTGGIVH